MNQDCVSARYFGWSGASIWTSERTRCGLPVILRVRSSIAFIVRVVGRSRIVKQLVLPADGQDIGMFGDDPERIEALRPGNAERIVGAQPAIGIMKAMIGIGGRIDEGRGNVGWNIHGVFRVPQKSLRRGIIPSQRIAVNRRAGAGSLCRVTDLFGISRQPSSILAFSG